MTIIIPNDSERLVVERADQIGQTSEQVAFDALPRALNGTVTPSASKDVWLTPLQRLATPAGVSLPDDALSSEAIDGGLLQSDSGRPARSSRPRL